MRRYGFILLFVLVLVMPFLARSKTSSANLRLVVVTPHVESIKREFADAFSEWHAKHFGEPVRVDYRVFGGASEMLRFFRSSEPSQRHIDVIWGGGTYVFDAQLKREGFLEPIQLDPAVINRAFPSPTLNQLKLYDPDRAWYGAALSAFGILYNKDVLRHLEVSEPSHWRDLADARLGGWFVAADPTRSASARQAFLIVVERAMLAAAASGRSEDDGWADGMGLIRLICSNARYFTDAASSSPNVIASGDAAAGMVIDFYGRAQVGAVGDRIGYVEPAGETSVDADPIAMARGVEHPELARRFIEFVLSEQGQRLWITKPGAPGGPKSTALRRLPIMRDIYRDQTDFTDHVDPFARGFAFESSPARLRTFNIVGELIEVSCMSLLDELRETRAAIERSPKRDELLARLARFPFDQAEALKRQAGYERATPLDKLALKRLWQEEFRAEYRALYVAATSK